MTPRKVNQIAGRDGEESGKAIAVREKPREFVPAPLASVLTLEELDQHTKLVHDLMRKHLREGEHYGTIPGAKKPSLWKSGAEKLGLLFQLIPKYLITREDLPNGHRSYEITCELYHVTGRYMGQGVGACGTMESKYRYRDQSVKCPKCGKETVIKGKEEYGGGWFCFRKKGGCGTTWADGSQEIEGQQRGKVENPDIADCWHTVLKMAKKRAHVDAALSTTSASDIFTQDLEDTDPEGAVSVAPSSPEDTAKKGVPGDGKHSARWIALNKTLHALFAAAGLQKSEHEIGLRFFEATAKARVSEMDEERLLEAGGNMRRYIADVGKEGFCAAVRAWEKEQRHDEK